MPRELRLQRLTPSLASGLRGGTACTQYRLPMVHAFADAKGWFFVVSDHDELSLTPCPGAQASAQVIASLRSPKARDHNWWTQGIEVSR